MAQSLAAHAFAGTAEKKCVVVDYYLTTIAKRTIKYAPVAQLDRALDSDVSGVSS